MIISGCINSPKTNDEKTSLNNDRFEDIPVDIENDSKTYLGDAEIENEKILEKHNINNNQEQLNITDINNTDSFELKENNTSMLIGLNNITEANNQFSFKLFSELNNIKNKNIFYSPYSIFTALAIAYEGAKGKTADEMQSIFRFPLDNDTRRNEFLKIINEINKDDKKYQLNVANALWAEQDYNFLEEYFKIIEEYYRANVTNMDFKNEPEDSRKIINNWIENKTNDKIKDLIPPGYIDPLTRLVITNAIYFKGKWKIQFDPNKTSEQDFYIDPNKSVEVPMMYLKDRFNYTRTKDFQILELPYEDSELSMLILLPNENNLNLIEESINSQNLSAWQKNLTETKIEIYIPKFKFETRYFLCETLKNMGIQSAFNPYLANFSGIDGTNNLYIGSVIHQAFVEVNEEGTEAAAATAVIVVTMGGGEYTPIFLANHPFIFLIQDRSSGNILFLGRVNDPTK
jgi:serpin B